MRKNQTSLTAAGIAVMRAVESERPADERTCYDPYARRFIPAWMYHVLGFFIRSGYAEWRGPGVNGFLAARERYIDDVLQGLDDAGIDKETLRAGPLICSHCKRDCPIVEGIPYFVVCRA